MKNNFPDYLTAFFTKHLTLHKGLSGNTVASYSDTFILFFQFCQVMCNIKQESIDFTTFNKKLVSDFCDWIESGRGCSISTRNLRLTAIHSFCRYVQAESPAYSSVCRDIINIPMKKCIKKPPNHLLDVEIKMLLAEPDVHTKAGIRDLAILALLYDSGTRVSELLNLNRGDMRITTKTTIRVIGKGNKMRLIPISPETGSIIKAYLKSNRIDMAQADDPMFYNRSGNRLSRPGITYILQKYAVRAREQNPGYLEIDITAHMVRHSKATHLLMSGVNLIYIRDFLGHSSVITTERYAKTNPEFMRKAIEACSKNNILGTDAYSDEQKNELTEFLKKYRL